MRLVLDTNVIISALLWGGKPKLLLERVFDGKDELFISREILDEIFGILSRDKFQLEKRIVNLFLHEIEEMSELIFPSRKVIDIVRDVDDHIILECALEADADVIVTGDNDLLVLEKFGTTDIMQVADFLERYGKFA